MSGHLNPIYLHLEGTDVRFFDTRHEQAAVWMADAYGRLTRRPGVAMVTAGPGFTNALTPIASASMAGTPLVLISGCVGIPVYLELPIDVLNAKPRRPVSVPVTRVGSQIVDRGKARDLLDPTSASTSDPSPESLTASLRDPVRNAGEGRGLFRPGGSARSRRRAPCARRGPRAGWGPEASLEFQILQEWKSNL